MYHWSEEWRNDPDLVDATFENAAIGIAHVGLDGSWLRVNKRLQEIVGYPHDELMRTTFQDITHPDDLETDLDLLEALIAGEIPHYQMEKRYFRKDGERIWVNLTVGLQRDPDGQPDFCISMIEDITSRKTDEKNLRIMIDELNHRVKNTLATVQAVAQLSFRKDEPVADAKNDFTARLKALSSAHDILTDEKWTGADLRQVVERALDPFNLDNTDRIDCRGPAIWLGSRQALTLAIGINELATNSVKYGALACDGHVRLQWEKRGADGLELAWIELDGPACTEPDAKGFGTTLLTRILPGDFKGSASLEYRETGLEYRLLAERMK